MCGWMGSVCVGVSPERVCGFVYCVCVWNAYLTLSLRDAVHDVRSGRLQQHVVLLRN